MWLGYALENAPGTHRLLNLQTNGVILSRDVRFLKQLYGDWIRNRTATIAPTEAAIVPTADDDDDDPEEQEGQPTILSDDENVEDELEETEG
jgi:hypothetical protein